MKMVNSTEEVSPPMIARASGKYCSLPVPSFNAIGTIPVMVASAVNQNRTRPHSSGWEYAHQRHHVQRRPRKRQNNQTPDEAHRNRQHGVTYPSVTVESGSDPLLSVSGCPAALPRPCLVPGGGFSRNRFPQRMLSARCSVLRNLSLFGLPLSPI